MTGDMSQPETQYTHACTHAFEPDPCIWEDQQLQSYIPPFFQAALALRSGLSMGEQLAASSAEAPLATAATAAQAGDLQEWTVLHLPAILDRQ